jgi:hypothetical protein
MRYAHLEQAQVSRKAVDVINLFQPSWKRKLLSSGITVVIDGIGLLLRDWPVKPQITALNNANGRLNRGSLRLVQIDACSSFSNSWRN